MPTLGGETERLRDLHDAYIWELNAAIGEGREDLVAELVEDHLADAMHEMSGGHLTDLDFPQGAIRVRPHAGSAGRRHHWWARHRA